MLRRNLLYILTILLLFSWQPAALARTHHPAPLQRHVITRKHAVAERSPRHLATRHKPLSILQAPLPKLQRKLVSRPPAQLPSLTDLVGYFRQQGMHAYQAGRYREAAAHFRKALDLKPDDQIARSWMVKLQGVAGRR